MPFSPTPREIVILCVLFVSLLYLSSSFTPSVENGVSQALDRSGFVVDDDSSALPMTLETQYTLQTLNPPLHWGTSHVPETKVVAHVPGNTLLIICTGWTIFDRLYLLNGTLYIVSDEPENVPERLYMISSGIFITSDPADSPLRAPTDKQMRVISTAEAHQLFGAEAERMDGVSWLAYDPKQFITHYYHWSAELFFGFWRTYSSLDPTIPPSGDTHLPAPRRMVFPHLDAANWRDYAAMNQWVVRACFPSMSMEFMNDWKERAALGRVFVFDRVVLADRAAAMNGEMYLRTQRTAANAFSLPGSVNWWTTIRNNVIGFSMQEGDYDVSSVDAVSTKPVITYVSRQGWTRRKLIQADHEVLVAELYKLRDTYGYEVNIVEMDKLTRSEQFRLAARTTIMMGVHGNGLTALLWMRPTPRSTVIEFFYPGGFAHDYEYTTRALGMVHYGFWDGDHFTRPDVPPVNYPEGFQGNEIPINGEAVARLVQERLTLAEEMDD
ncbi:uncharacterized protein BXZ73DRAFT_42246 [Epithele typhae]|uniref:uncharacterized protein n=1 Tax=Epithele typhae TaxID=378194 RepID=UPI002007AC3A|nr:uncharacterized protein BXZ73DRAFT_42246 [Epithele typhae]KAH9941287.1 hypothetical protein BXZ73DRAFT_42246 [Epithele typhae]